MRRNIQLLSETGEFPLSGILQGIDHIYTGSMIISLCMAAGLAVPAAFAEDGWLDLLNWYKTSSE
jgi:hypothetical protein